MLNTQAPEKRVHHDGSVLSVHSIFHTLQGEGPFCGTPAVFVRLAGCNLQCPLCDTQYTEGRYNLDVGDFIYEIDRVRNEHTRLVVITGGEPFRQNLAPLLETLILNGFFVQIETNGSLPPSDFYMGWQHDISRRQGAYIVCSPKAGKIHQKLEDHICAYKYVLGANTPITVFGLPTSALDHPARPYLAQPKWFNRLIYLQPVDYGDEKLNKIARDRCVHTCLKYGYIMQLQTHKILGVE